METYFTEFLSGMFDGVAKRRKSHTRRTNTHAHIPVLFIPLLSIKTIHFYFILFACLVCGVHVTFGWQ